MAARAAMRSRTAIIIIVSLVAAGAGGTGGDVIISYPSVFAGLSRPAVVFPHERHYNWGLGCLDCHHRYENGLNVLTENELQPGTPAVSCASCHGTARDLERSYHVKCIGCHRDMKKRGSSTGPVMCGQCHLKKEN